MKNFIVINESDKFIFEKTVSELLKKGYTITYQGATDNRYIMFMFKEPEPVSVKYQVNSDRGVEELKTHNYPYLRNVELGDR